MTKARLSVHSDAAADSTDGDAAMQYHESATVKVNAGETLALMMHAARTQRTWLADFADDTIEVSRDMYEVLLAYKRVATITNRKAA